MAKNEQEVIKKMIVNTPEAIRWFHALHAYSEVYQPKKYAFWDFNYPETESVAQEMRNLA